MSYGRLALVFGSRSFNVQHLGIAIAGRNLKQRVRMNPPKVVLRRFRSLADGRQRQTAFSLPLRRKSSIPCSTRAPILRHTTIPLEDEKKTHISVLELNSPSDYNALSSEMLHKIEHELKLCNSSYPDCRAVILSASSESKAFSAGHDLLELQRYIQNNDRVAVRELFETCQRVMLLLQEIRPVTIAQAHGVVTAAGCQLLTACDFAVACESARFALSGISVGLACSTPVVPLSHKAIPLKKKALEMLLTGDFCSAVDAERFGLVNLVVTTESTSLQNETVQFAKRIARHSSFATARGKEMFYQQINMEYKDALQFATNRIVDDICCSEDAAAGIDAFCGKKGSPEWKGR